MSQYARTNNATKAHISVDHIYSSGTFKNVWAGFYLDGERAGQPCVAKGFKSTGIVFEDHYYDEELAIIALAQKIIDDFHALGRIKCTILLNTPNVGTCFQTGQKNLIEPMIHNFEKFNSNTGWTLRSGHVWSEAMQALSHFSYHNSNGQLLLCDIQGGSYNDGYVLTDPVVMSQARNCGPADLGHNGINSFFRRHTCSRYCSRTWIKPAAVEEAKYPMREGTTMTSFPSHQSRNPLSRVHEATRSERLEGTSLAQRALEMARVRAYHQNRLLRKEWLARNCVVKIPGYEKGVQG